MRKGNKPPDVRDTLKRQLIEQHFDGLGDELKWTTQRYNTLCHAMSLTVYELGAVVRASISDVERWLLANQFPPAVELHLTFIERAVLRAPHITPLFPPL